jgi:hypothetical protein
MRDGKTPATVRLAELAARQHAIVDLTDLETLSIGRPTAGRWASAGRLHRLYPGVFSVVPPSLLSEEGEWLAAVKAGGPHAALSHGPAGQAQWIVDRSLHRAMHVTVSDRVRRRPEGIVIHRPRLYDPSVDVIVRQGIPMTTPTRTVWDLAATDLPSVTRRAYERAEAKSRIDRTRLRELLAAKPHHRGAGLLHRLLAQGYLPLARVRTWLEQLLIHICSEHGLPQPAVNVPLLGYEADFLWEREKFVVEADGGDHLTPRQRDKDNERDIAFGRAGYLVRRYSSTAMGHEPRVEREVRSILLERAAR